MLTVHMHFPVLQPTLLTFEKAAPDFVGMALQHLDLTISSWEKLDAEGVTLPAVSTSVARCTT